MVIFWRPFSSDIRLTTRALHWDAGGPPAMSAARRDDLAKAQLQTFCSRCALTAGGPPALPVKSSSAQATAPSRCYNRFDALAEPG